MPLNLKGCVRSIPRCRKTFLEVVDLDKDSRDLARRHSFGAVAFPPSAVAWEQSNETLIHPKVAKFAEALL